MACGLESSLRKHVYPISLFFDTTGYVLARRVFKLMHISERVVCDKNNHFTTFLLSVEWPVDRMKKEVRLMNRKYGTVILIFIRKG